MSAMVSSLPLSDEIAQFAQNLPINPRQRSELVQAMQVLPSLSPTHTLTRILTHTHTHTHTRAHTHTHTHTHTHAHTHPGP